MMAALGIAVKQVIQPLVQVVTGPLLIPARSRGHLHAFIVLGFAIVRKRFTALLICAAGGHRDGDRPVRHPRGREPRHLYASRRRRGTPLFFFTRLKATSSKPCRRASASRAASSTASARSRPASFFNLPSALLLVSSRLAPSGGLGGLLAFSPPRQTGGPLPAGREEGDGEDIDIDKEPDEAGTEGKAAADDSGTDDLPR